MGEALLVKACEHFGGFGQNYAFFHIFGMSCNAHHGKLHNSQFHVDNLLRETGFQIEHKNAYYALDMMSAAPAKDLRTHFRSICGSSEERFEVRLNSRVVGTAQVRYLDRLTGGVTFDTAYLTWIGVAEKHRSQGIGTGLMNYLVQYLVDKGYRYLHTDTASGNISAQQFYQKLGFKRLGYTRSYVKA